MKTIAQKIEMLRKDVTDHKVYTTITTVEDLKIFMKYHIFAVWDFMSLLKSLQVDLTCTTIPWFPKGSAETRYLINEIVVGEESDVDAEGARKSHFELYLDAMDQCRADTSQMMKFIETIQSGASLEESLETANVPMEARKFVKFTFDMIDSHKTYLTSAVFTFGREDLIPDMFLALVKDLDSKVPGSVSVFKYYLERHIEVDGDHHSHLARKMTENLCGNSEGRWKEVEEAVLECLRRRMELWDGAYKEMKSSKALKEVSIS